ncbi:subclass B3 metallo-beta-lactamase [Pseudoxanthomonas indica]|uniref:Metallo-beta-lactamase class B n=1 Tax=Pseudoxanthomonas indica TaxID=428993 RepID=A0A1T5J7Y3_9GAMM|nr:subclass B3 metallo-beta-lactamase [Pseudoxanthomonas indica]GGD56928.1 subclass B3 metallo-beta-lactamase BJP-1 [Pseudoxanthomonas indica]SKC47382.1 metallo-beta-lactamase class B [Pseudoxanthomonas indica]
MRSIRCWLPSVLLLAFAHLAQAAQPAPANDVKPFECDSCAEWNQPHAPFKLYGNSYYVGTEGLSSILIDTGQGLVLLDGALPQSAPVIAGNIRALGFKPEDITYIGMSHAHFDHAGGIAALVRMSGGKAVVLATARGAEALRAGDAPDDDPQAHMGGAFPPVKSAIKVLTDGQTLQLGNTTLQIHATPGHTPGGSAWTWRSCEQQRCLDMVYADSLTPVSADEFKFGPADGARVAEFRRTIAKVGALPCDFMVSAHPGFSELFEREQKQRDNPGSRALENPGACRVYAEQATQRLDQRLRDEAGR